MNASPMTPDVTGRAVDQKILWSYFVSLTSVVFMPKKLVTNDLEGIENQRHDGENPNRPPVTLVKYLDPLLRIVPQGPGSLSQDPEGSFALSLPPLLPMDTFALESEH
ncbi:hypothetical protein GQ607_015305 [Colletotrichum asianum]|uniref:Uncharacterized protein n=1 Tax=Colletotrichum asianum TaxID=702518 RepID=A0A8H3ZF89_9PEZI|nr:hypothetical protein GQ607_015305 [Colletotrichum asianum]